MPKNYQLKVILQLNTGDLVLKNNKQVKELVEKPKQPNGVKVATLEGIKSSVFWLIAASHKPAGDLSVPVFSTSANCLNFKAIC